MGATGEGLRSNVGGSGGVGIGGGGWWRHRVIGGYGTTAQFFLMKKVHPTISWTKPGGAEHAGRGWKH